jgi:hypothetical protein
LVGTKNATKLLVVFQCELKGHIFGH